MTNINSKTLFVSDLDGTLLDNVSQVSERSARLINDAVTHGVMFTVATARTAATVVPLLRNIHMKIPAVVMTGAALWDFDKGRYRDARFISANDTRKIINAFELAGVHPFVYTLPEESDNEKLQVYCNNVCPSKIEEEFLCARQSLSLKTINVGESCPVDMYGRVLIFCAMGCFDKLEKARILIERETDCNLTFYGDNLREGVYYLEVFAPGVSKSSALKQLCRQFNVEKLVVFGDSVNDLSMFEIADRAIAVDNAPQNVKDKAHKTIGANNTDSVAEYISDASKLL